MLRLLEISTQPCKLSLEGKSLTVISPKGERPQRIPLDELDVLLLGHPALSISGALLAELGRSRVAVVCCDFKSLPTAIMMPFNVGALSHEKTLEAQFNMTQPQRKRIWQQIVREKIRGQAAVLRKYRNSSALDGLEKAVRSGDAGNHESQAAVLYWRTLDLFPKRSRVAEDANQCFNYAYALLYATTARYICAYAMHPQLSLSHCNPHNSFCLASDLMEPFRPLVDDCVIPLVNEYTGTLTPNWKRKMLEAFSSKPVSMEDSSVKMPEAIRMSILSFRQCLLGTIPKIITPNYKCIFT